MDDTRALRERVETLEMLAAGELRREASAGIAGLMRAADYSKLAGVGTVATSYLGADVAVAATTVTSLVTITLTPGVWVTRGVLMALMGGTGNIIACALQTAAGAAVGGVSNATLAASAWGMLDVWTFVAPTVSTGYRLACYGNSAFSAKWSAALFGNGTETGIQAWRIA